jgi:AraC family transcriptional regulator
MSLTVSGSGVAVYPPGATFGPRRLEDFEFVWLLQGTAEWRYDQGSIALGPNSLLLGRPGITDSFSWDRTRPTRHAYLHFELTGRLPELPDPDQRRLPPHLDTLLELVRRAWSPPAPTRPLSLHELAAGACISTGYLSRVFRRHYGIGPVAALELLRLARAATLLARSNLSVAAVAHDCGFANPYHFSMV